MDGLYGLQYSSSTEYSDKAGAAFMMSPENLIFPSDNYHQMSSFYSSEAFQNRINPLFASDELLSAASAISETTAVSIAPPEIQPGGGGGGGGGEDDMSTFIKAKIASHPSYPRLLQAYIDCQKVGAPPEIAGFLDEIRRDNDIYQGDCATTCLGADPELDEFMETYCDVLLKYKSDLERPFDEATTFLNKIEMQLRNLSTGASIRTNSDEGAGASSDEELSGGEVEVQEGQPSSEDRDLKDKLLRRFGSHISTLKLEFSKKKKKGKLPKEARQTLLEWWNLHYKWPYPTEADKIALAESTGLDQKQINNWFINQRKRHWKPSENMQYGVMDDISGQFYTDD